ncbi:MAG: V-type ATP synthase subunit D [Actinomycetota bacterium]
MEQASPTRTELLAKKAQIELAEQGRDLLKEKRDALIVEFMSVMDTVVRSSSRLGKVASEAYYTLTLAKAVDGTVAVRSASFATSGEVRIEVTGTHIMGVYVPEITKKSVRRTLLTRGYSPTAVSSRIDEMAEKYEEELDIILDIAAIETRLKRLGEEIQKTRRRVNALDNNVIPNLKEQVKYIQTTLEERAREDLFRLKKVKKAIEKKKALLQAG